MKIGDIFITNDGCEAFVVEIIGAKCVIEYMEPVVYRKLVYRANLEKGEAKNDYKPTLYGIGYTGHGAFGRLSKHPMQKIASKTWVNMMTRCYFEEFHKRQKSYIGATVSEEWHNFQNFAAWMSSDESCYVEGFALDKDLLSNGESKIYSKDTCIFIPRWLNSFIISEPQCDSTTGHRGITVSSRNGKFLLRMSDKMSESYKYKHMGTFETLEDAIDCKNKKNAEFKQYAINRAKNEGLSERIIKSIK